MADAKSRQPLARYALYRYFDVSGRLLYVGKTGDVAVRGRQHIKRSEWMQFAVRSTIKRYDSAESVGRAERRAIKAEQPVFNRQYNDTPEARERLRVYLKQADRLDLLPKHVAEDASGDILLMLRQILTADTTDHTNVRLRAVAVLEGHTELPGGRELARLAALTGMSLGTAYRMMRKPLPMSVLADADAQDPLSSGAA